MTRYERLRGRYYLMPLIQHLKERGLTIEQIADTLDCSVSTIKYVGSKGDMIEPELVYIDNNFGLVDPEFLRESALYKACETLASRGWQVGVTDGKCIYDLLAEKKSKFIKLQVRSSTIFSSRGWPIFKTSKVRYNMTSCKRVPYSIGDFDFWFFHSINGDSWIIPFLVITQKAEVSMEGLDEYCV